MSLQVLMLNQPLGYKGTDGPDKYIVAKLQLIETNGANNFFMARQYTCRVCDIKIWYANWTCNILCPTGVKKLLTRCTSSLPFRLDVNIGPITSFFLLISFYYQGIHKGSSKNATTHCNWRSYHVIISFFFQWISNDKSISLHADI